MTLISAAYIRALLSDACYVDKSLTGLSSQKLIEALTPRMTLPLAEFIGNNFTAIAQTPAYVSGFSATIWQGNAGTAYAGQIYVAMRGTEPGLPDYLTDADLAISGIAHGQLEDMVNWWVTRHHDRNGQTDSLYKDLE